jgi:hypothetical protein
MSLGKVKQPSNRVTADALRTAAKFAHDSRRDVDTGSMEYKGLLGRINACWEPYGGVGASVSLLDVPVDNWAVFDLLEALARRGWDQCDASWEPAERSEFESSLSPLPGSSSAEAAAIAAGLSGNLGFAEQFVAFLGAQQERQEESEKPSGISPLAPKFSFEGHHNGSVCADCGALGRRRQGDDNGGGEAAAGVCLKAAQVVMCAFGDMFSWDEEFFVDEPGSPDDDGVVEWLAFVADLAQEDPKAAACFRFGPGTHWFMTKHGQIAGNSDMNGAIMALPTAEAFDAAHEAAAAGVVDDARVQLGLIAFSGCSD